MKASTIKAPIISLVTAHGRQALGGEPDDRLIDVLNRNNVPWSAVSVYVVNKDGSEPSLFPSLDRKLSEFDTDCEVLLYFNRNVNPYLFALSNYHTVDTDHDSVDQIGTEYFYQHFDSANSSVEIYLKKLSPEECRQVIADRVADTLHVIELEQANIVVGISGGGDSNAMLYGLNQLRTNGLKIHPVIIKGIPDWDSGVPRAQELCEKYGVPLTVMEEPEVRALLSIPDNGPSLIDRFERVFSGDDFEFMGTLLIRLALMAKANEIGTRYICTGLNLEDVLCEAIFRIAGGMKPAAFPLRSIGDFDLVMPLWLCPKRIIDGCFPKLSLDNYEARYPCFSVGRNLYYSVIYTIQSQYPGFAEQMARGISRMAEQAPVQYHFDESLGFHVERFVPFPLREKFGKMLAD